MAKGSKKAGNRKAGKRTASGQLSRSKEAVAERAAIAHRETFEEGPMQTVLKARRRHSKEFREPHKPSEWEQPVSIICKETGTVTPPLYATAMHRQIWKRERRPVTKEEAAKLVDLGSILGKMKAAGHITAREAAAGSDYCQRYITYAATHGLPRPTPQGPAYGEVRGASRPERIKAAIAARSAHEADQRILRHCSAGVTWAIKRACVLEDAAPRHLVKEGLAALVSNGR